MKYIKSLFETRYYNKSLNPQLWNNFMLNQKVRDKLVLIAEDFYRGLELDTPFDDILLTGSMCNFNYNEYSDLDVHIVVDFTQVANNQKIVTDYFDIKAKFYNDRHDITIKGYDVEIYIQDKNAPLYATAVYSLINNNWLTKPNYNPPLIDDKLVQFKYQTYKSGINEFVKRSQMNLTPEQANINYQYAKNFKKKISKIRKESLAVGGEFSVGNLIFKQLRNQGDFGRLMDAIAKLYDKIYIE